MQHHEAYEIDRLSRIALENLTGSEVLALDRIASPVKKLKALNSAGVALRAGTQARSPSNGPGIIQALRNAFAAAQLRDAVIAAQPVQHNPDRLFGRMAQPPERLLLHRKLVNVEDVRGDVLVPVFQGSIRVPVDVVLVLIRDVRNLPGRDRFRCGPR